MAEQHQQMQQQHQAQHITAQILNVQGGVATLDDSVPVQIMMPAGVVMEQHHQVQQEQQIQVPQHVQEMQEVIQEAVGSATTQVVQEDPKLTNKKELSKQWKSLCKRAKQWCSMHDDSVPNFVMMYLDENRLVWEGPDHMESFISDESVISAFLRTAALSESLIGMEKRGVDEMQDVAPRPAKKQKKAETPSTSKKGMTDDEVIASILEKPEAVPESAAGDEGAGADGDDSDGDNVPSQTTDTDQPSQSTSEGPTQSGEGDVLSQVIESVIKDWAPGQGPPPTSQEGEEETGDASDDKDGTTDVYIMVVDEEKRLPKGQLVKTTLGKSALKSKMKAQSNTLTIVRSKDIYVYKTMDQKMPKDLSFSVKKAKRKGVPRRLRQGVLQARGSRPHRCNLCSKCFTTSQKLTVHLRRHAGEKPFQCDQCDKRFYLGYMLRTHVKITHEGQRPFECEQCSAKFTQKRHLKMHTKIYHDNIVREMTVNPEGRLVLAKERNHICQACNRRFLSNSDLARHLRIHTGEKPFTCDSCQKGFARKSDLTKHLRIHTGEKPYACSYCGQRFRELSNMKSHFRTHTKEQWPCQICGKIFTTSKALRTHNLNHAQGEAAVEATTAQEGVLEQTLHPIVSSYDQPPVEAKRDPVFRSPIMLIPTQPRGAKTTSLKPDQSDKVRHELSMKKTSKPDIMKKASNQDSVQQHEIIEVQHVELQTRVQTMQPLPQVSHHHVLATLPQHTVASHETRPYEEEEDFNPAAVLQSLQTIPQVHNATPQSMGGPVSYAQVYPAPGVSVFSRNMYSQPMPSYMTFQSIHDHGHVQHPVPHNQHQVQHSVPIPNQVMTTQHDDGQQLMMHQQHDLQSLLRK